MGRELHALPNGDWWVIENTSNAFKRVSTVFDSRDAIVAALSDGGLLPDILDDFRSGSNYVAGMRTVAVPLPPDGTFTLKCDKAIDEALKKAGCFDTKHDDCVNPEHLEEANSFPAGFDISSMISQMMNGRGTPGSTVHDQAMRERMERNGTYEPQRTGSTVELFGLSRAEYNGLRACVLGVGKDGRQPVRVSLPDGATKDMRIKYGNMVRTQMGGRPMTREELDSEIRTKNMFDNNPEFEAQNQLNKMRLNL